MKIKPLEQVHTSLNVHNDKENGVVDFTIFQEDDHFVGVCLTFDLIYEGASYPEVRDMITKLAMDYLNYVKNSNLSDSLLNRPAPREFWEKIDGKNKRSATHQQTRISTYYNPQRAILV
jgi:hypothetical protein